MSWTPELLQVVNAALIRLGEPTIDSLDQDGATAAAVRAVLPTAVDLCFDDHRWSWAETSAELVVVSPQPDSIYAAQGYVLRARPAHMVRLWELRTPFARLSDWWPTAEGLWVPVSADQRVFAIYVARQPALNWPPWFRELVEVTLAERLAIALREDSDSVAAYQRARVLALASARNRDAASRPTSRLPLTGFEFERRWSLR